MNSNILITTLIQKIMATFQRPKSKNSRQRARRRRRMMYSYVQSPSDTSSDISVITQEHKELFSLDKIYTQNTERIERQRLDQVPDNNVFIFETYFEDRNTLHKCMFHKPKEISIHEPMMIVIKRPIGSHEYKEVMFTFSSDITRTLFQYRTVHEMTITAEFTYLHDDDAKIYSAIFTVHQMISDRIAKYAYIDHVKKIQPMIMFNQVYAGQITKYFGHIYYNDISMFEGLVIASDKITRLSDEVRDMIKTDIIESQQKNHGSYSRVFCVLLYSYSRSYGDVRTEELLYDSCTLVA